MNSRIELSSEPGKGSLFYFSIPARYMQNNNIEHQIPDDIKTVLIVDDNENNTGIVSKMLNAIGIESLTAFNGIEALKLLERKKNIDLILIDHQMPYQSGIDTIRIIKEHPALDISKTPLILMHDITDESMVQKEAMEFEVNYILSKPVKFKELIYSIKNIHNTHVQEEIVILNNEISSEPVLILQDCPRVLIAEDVEINAILIQTMLKEFLPEATILLAKNGVEAVDFAVSSKPDIIFMDIQMPRMDGIEATNRIREMEKSTDRRTVIIALTAKTQEEAIEKAKQVEMDGFLSKPVLFESLKEVLLKHLKSVHAAEKDNTLEIRNDQSIDHFDLNELTRRIGDNKEILKKLITSAPANINEYLNALDNAIKEKNINEIKDIAHAIKGISLTMSYKKMAIITKSMETGHFEKTEELYDLYDALKREWALLELILKSTN